ncbi:hypothetical protein DH2020_035940 [Rehmannia glutinosa]|uniref:DUF3700 domain-containing protein n=1 Tax=Rehmannia glutinosa TaxID=99300 RepID=A0ABR0V7A2_REHGL
MLGVFSSSIVSPPDELVAAGSRTPSPKVTAAKLLARFVEANSSAVSVQIGDHVQLAYTHHNQSAVQPRSFAVKDEIFCLFEGALDNLGSLKQQYGLAKSANEDQYGKVPLYWGITADGYVAFADDADLLKGACGKSLASFPQGCFFSTAAGDLEAMSTPIIRLLQFLLMRRKSGG